MEPTWIPLTVLQTTVNYQNILEFKNQLKVPNLTAISVQEMEPAWFPLIELTVNRMNLLELTAKYTNHLKSAELTANRLNVEHRTKDTGESLLGARLEMEGFSWARGHDSAPLRGDMTEAPRSEKQTEKSDRTSG